MWTRERGLWHFLGHKHFSPKVTTGKGEKKKKDGQFGKAGRTKLGRGKGRKVAPAHRARSNVSEA